MERPTALRQIACRCALRMGVRRDARGDTKIEIAKNEVTESRRLRRIAREEYEKVLSKLRKYRDYHGRMEDDD